MPILATAREIASGMAHLHSMNILHGDLTSLNVLLASSDIDNRGFIAKVTHALSMHWPTRCIWALGFGLGQGLARSLFKGTRQVWVTQPVFVTTAGLSWAMPLSMPGRLKGVSRI